ncbi:major facilitator superfamily domain-containing protein 6-like [Trichogramma pretiosum]|uniref:major facilitator superfamily domain-containing protein 6-like n=1 Tax=Trichogramma pretiosum TaxID=7493 RepID=UPI0006C95430|nr:major facilitator superfamily domain-containing protein 6-like [Trichogramma pretiosum]XP_014238904.1 major facilitator superfamily domain-containing protein 6-like [Trichogramma pretiosum]
MTMLKGFFRRIGKDLRQKKLIPLKLIFFVNTSTLYILYPYLTLHMRELGISVEETAIMSAITPFVAIIMPPVAGLVADRIGNFKLLLSLFSAFGGAASLLLLLVPIGRITMQFPESVVLSARCQQGAAGGGELVYAMSQNHPCDSKQDAKLVELELQSCGYACPMSTSRYNHSEIQEAIMSTNYRFNVWDPNESTNSSYDFEISDSDMPHKMKIIDDGRESRKLQNIEFYQVAIRQLSKNTLFFPANNPRLVDFHCSGADEARGRICRFKPDLSPSSRSEKESRIFPTYLKALEVSGSDKEDSLRRYRSNSSSSCPASDERTRVEVDLASSGESIASDECTRSCIFTAPRAELCTNAKITVEYNTSLTFWAYLAIRVFMGVIGGTSFAMFEGAVIAILREQKADYGLQRIYGSIGGMISSPLSGLLIDYASEGKGYTDFRPAFYLYATLKIFTAFVKLLINLEFKAPATNVVKDVIAVLKNVEIVALLVASFVLGTAWGFIESFLFWLLQDLGASRSLMGITITVGGIAGIPLLVLSGPIIDKIGHANVLFIGFVFYAIRLVGYSLIYDPWLCLIFEALESVTSSLSFTAAVTYAAKLSTTTTDSSIQGLLGGLYYGVGKGAGSLVGGYLIKFYGTRPTYQIFSVVTLFTGFLYLFFNLTYLAKRPQVEGNEIVKKEPKVTTKETAVQKDSTTPHLKELENTPYLVDDIEAMNNAKNLDIVEAVNNQDEDDEVEEQRREVDNEMRHRNLGLGKVNMAFEADNDTAKHKKISEV